MSNQQLKWMIIGLMAAFVLYLGVSSFIIFYPFKTVIFKTPIKIDNLDNRVPYNGIVNLTIQYEKFINLPTLSIRTLIRKDEEGIITILDANSVVYHRPAGKGISHTHYILDGSTHLIGKKTSIVFSLYYTVFGFRSILTQYETEPFEIYDPATEVKK